MPLRGGTGVVGGGEPMEAKYPEIDAITWLAVRGLRGVGSECAMASTSMGLFAD